MPVDLDRLLPPYSELIVRVALNLQPGQRLIIIGPLAYGGLSIDAAPLVRHVTEAAYKAGSPYVESIWGDEALTLLRFAHAPQSSFDQFSRWLPKALVEHVEAGDATLSIYANDPDLLAGQPMERVSGMQRSSSLALSPFREQISRRKGVSASIAERAVDAALGDDQPAVPARRRGSGH